MSDVSTRPIHGGYPTGPRPRRLMSAAGSEQVVRTRDGRSELVLRQVGWIGQSGHFYSLDEDPSPTERGGFSPLLFVAHEDRVVDREVD